MNDDIDDLDRTLFALPLEPAPVGLRDAILRATIGAPARAGARSLPLGSWEIAGVGALLAIATWLVMTLVADRSLATDLTVNAVALTYEIVRTLSEPMTMLWLAAGGAVVAWFAFGNAVAENRLLRGRS